MNTDNCVREITQVTDIAERDLFGWAYWQFKTFKDLTTTAGEGSEGFYDPDGTFHTDKVRIISRPYVKLAQGDIVSNRVDKETGRFEATIKLNVLVNAPSVIHTFSKGKGAHWYPNGVNYKIKDQNGRDITSKAKIVNLSANEFAFQFEDTGLHGN